MSTAHWGVASYDTSFSAGFFVRNLDVAVPAGATMKRFLTNGVRVSARFQSRNYQEINVLWWDTTVEIIAGQYAPRELFKIRRRVPMNVVGLFNPVAGPFFDTQYTQWILGADLELALNERTAYGTSDGPGFTVRCQTSLHTPPGSLAFPDGVVTCQFKVLYFTP